MYADTLFTTERMLKEQPELVKNSSPRPSWLV